MYHVLLVDDEPRHLAGLSRMLQSLRPEYVIRTAKNGVEALAICEQTTFQIIITDIQMPLKDGLDFIGNLPYESGPRKVIFLSGYGYFDYAQKAIGLGSFEYLLKPVDIDKFTQVLERAERSIQEELLVQEEMANMERQLKRVVPVYQQSVMNRWLKGEQLTATLQEVEEIVGFRGAGRVMLIDMQSTGRYKLKVEPIVLQIQKALEKLTGGEHSCCCCMIDNHANQLIMVTNAELSESDGQRLTAAMIDIEKDFVDSELRITVGISDKAIDILSEGSRLLIEAKLACESRFYLPGRRVYAFKQSMMLSDHALVFESKDAEAFIERLQKCEDPEFQLPVEQLYDRLLATGRPIRAVIISYSTQLLTEVINSIEYLGQEEVRSWLLDVMQREVKDVPDLECLKSNVSAVLLLISKKLHEMKQKRKDALIYQCLAYIDEHYMEDLSLESVAAIMHFSPGYFSNYFKNKLTINFSQYLTQVRLTKAKEFLMDSNDKVYHIAAKLGYHDAKYFNRVFKKEFGLTPEEYRTIARSMSHAREV
ncbi:response regulator [Paenibacillus hexagrammi]|uniref:Response regulator n=1 Tax=Paenibacillus hexagrammi TaxID=2908839 RepID=A0ABY3SP46_9BACL|nr:response regulator [Paenibacillus sp. YPD9-1]UJF35479.1 response regulator [Paenibacillus sp. YPD9-1]